MPTVDINSWLAVVINIHFFQKRFSSSVNLRETAFPKKHEKKRPFTTAKPISSGFVEAPITPSCWWAESFCCVWALSASYVSVRMRLWKYQNGVPWRSSDLEGKKGQVVWCHWWVERGGFLGASLSFFAPRKRPNFHDLGLNFCMFFWRPMVSWEFSNSRAWKRTFWLDSLDPHAPNLVVTGSRPVDFWGFPWDFKQPLRMGFGWFLSVYLKLEIQLIR